MSKKTYVLVELNWDKSGVPGKTIPIARRDSMAEASVLYRQFKHIMEVDGEWGARKILEIVAEDLAFGEGHYVG